MDIESLVARVLELPDCVVTAPMGIPEVRQDNTMPEDLRHFYMLCGGVELCRTGDYPIRIVSPLEVLRPNPVIIGELEGIPNGGIPEGDQSEDWYIIADDYNGDYLRSTWAVSA